MEDKDILKELDKIYYLLDTACGNCIIENEERESMQKAICSIQEKYKQDEKVIEEMALYIRNIKTDYNQEYCNVKNCDYHKTYCSSKCIIDYFRKECE